MFWQRQHAGSGRYSDTKGEGGRRGGGGGAREDMKAQVIAGRSLCLALDVELVHLTVSNRGRLCTTFKASIRGIPM